MKFFKSTFFLVALIAAQTVYAQDAKKEKEAVQAEAVKNKIDGKRYVFQAQSAMPMKGKSRQLSPGYTLTVSPDTVMCDLPYFGRAYQAPMNASEGGIKFTSTDFEYTVKNQKKGGWDIQIKPKDVRNSSQVSLSISAKGYASLRVISTDRESISFNGYIER